MNYKTILINLKKDTDRLEFMTKQLNKLEIEFEKLEAINGKEYLITNESEHDENPNIEKYGKKMTAGEIGCALSHKRCYQKFLNDPIYKNVKYLLILEDDIKLDKNFKNILEEEIKKNDKKYKWNYLQLNYCITKNLKSIFFSIPKKYGDQYRLLKIINSPINKLKRIPIFIFGPLFSSFFIDFLRFFQVKIKGVHKFRIRNSFLTGAYLIDKNVAKILLKLTEKIIFPADITTAIRLYKYRSKKMNFYFYAPLIAEQDRGTFKSSIDKMEKRIKN